MSTYEACPAQRQVLHRPIYSSLARWNSLEMRAGVRLLRGARAERCQTAERDLGGVVSVAGAELEGDRCAVGGDLEVDLATAYPARSRVGATVVVVRDARRI